MQVKGRSLGLYSPTRDRDLKAASNLDYTLR
jgi:hypothetical protein